ncbi:glutaminase [Dictyocaulus viviparus]|uniref:glutaminase n=1 Tax=Dictyocaulus viviparus TaxID=29172 RepID=A0A0D8Y6M9_DICVI|nr:glutaminase [Dictyocaulus viviparus]
MRQNTVVGQTVRRTLSHESSHGSQLQELIFDLYRDEKTNKIFIPRFFKEWTDAGIRKDDPRLQDIINQVREAEANVDEGVFNQEHLFLDKEAFKRCVGNSIGVIGKALKKQLVIPDWTSFTTVMGNLYEQSRIEDSGLSVSKPFTYALVHEEIGPDDLHSHVGQEPSGRLFNDICLDHNSLFFLFYNNNNKYRQQKPHNPLINAGAIVVASLMKRHASLSDRFDFVFPPDTNLQDTLDLYFQLCAIETNCDSMAVMAATLANGGVNPMNSERVINNRACRDTLSLMYSCGMYDWSGQFAFRVGLPAKSGVSGDMIMVIPNVMGIAIYSPRLDTLGNTFRGLKFAEAFISKFNFHNYDSLVYSDCQKMDPRKVIPETEHDNTSRFMFAAKYGDISTIKRYLLLGIDIHERDYDDRTVLHVAASEGDSSCLKYLLSKWRESPASTYRIFTSVIDILLGVYLFVFVEPRDRFGRTPLDDAKFFKHEECERVLQEFIDQWTCNE